MRHVRLAVLPAAERVGHADAGEWLLYRHCNHVRVLIGGGTVVVEDWIEYSGLYQHLDLRRYR